MHVCQAGAGDKHGQNGVVSNAAAHPDGQEAQPGGAVGHLAENVVSDAVQTVNLQLGNQLGSGWVRMVVWTVGIERTYYRNKLKPLIPIGRLLLTSSRTRCAAFPSISGLRPRSVTRWH